jgi:hypothetical protein
MIGKITGVAMAMMMLCATSALAVDNCKVKVDKKTGLLLVSASGVSGTLLWGSTDGAATMPFFNAATCVTADKASKCEIADPATLAAKTPPSGCTLYLDDDGAPCSAWIAGCTPGERSPSGCVRDPAASPRFVDNGDGTVSDRTTCLMWEKKTGTAGTYANCPGGASCASEHDVRNLYGWTVGSPYNPDGAAFFAFLAKLNGPSPFAGYDDWRLPTVTELQSIVDLTASGCGSGSPCIDAVFGPTQLGGYWSSSTYYGNSQGAWYVYFFTGAAYFDSKANGYSVRAVRAVS